MLTDINPTEPRREYEAGSDDGLVRTVLPQERLASSAIQANLIETWGSYVVQMTLPGARLESLKIEVVARRLTVQGSFDVPVIENGSFVWHGIPGGEFCREFDLPGEVNGDKSEARFDRGILTVELAKVAHLKPSTIPVRKVG